MMRFKDVGVTLTPAKFRQGVWIPEKAFLLKMQFKDFNSLQEIVELLLSFIQ